MTGIKPPGGPRSGPPTTTQEAPATGTSAKDFGDALTESASLEAAKVAAKQVVGEGGHADAVRDAATAEARIEALVAEALTSPAAAGLDARGREALAAHLRATLADDPSFARWLGGRR